MNDKLGKFVTEKPQLTVIIVLLITFFMMALNASPGSFGLEKKETEREDDWLPANDVVTANTDINDNYGVQVRSLQVLVKGENGNVLTKEALIDILTVEKQIATNPKVQYILFPQPGNLSSIASMLGRNILGDQASYDEMIEDLQARSQENISEMITNAAEHVGMFLTKDFSDNLDAGQVKAKGTFIWVQLNSDRYDEIEEGGDNPVLDGALEIEKITKDTEFQGVSYMGILEDEYMSYMIEEETGGVMGFLFMMVFVLIIIILFLSYRSIFDTVISLLALIFAIAWMDGIGVILGLTFTSMYQIVPIMLMGLGVDYAIHLVMRYREERTQLGKNVKDSLMLTTISVGAALFLATVTTAVSFGSNMVSEIKPMREFAIFSFVGIISAFIVMVTFVPASKMLLHGWQEKNGKKEFRKLPTLNGNGNGANGKKSAVVPENALSMLLAKGAVAAEHHAIPVVAGVLVLSLVCAGMAMQLETEFDFTEFLPADAQITDDIKYLTGEFDFGTEESDILVKGDITDPDVLRAMNNAEQEVLNDKNINQQDPIESILTLMKDVANDGGEFEKDENFSAMYLDSDTTGDGVPDTNVSGLYEYLGDNEDYQFNLIRVLHFDNETKTYDGSVIRVAVNSQNGAKNEEISDELKDDLKPLEDEPKVDKAVATGGPVLFQFVIHSIEVSGMQSLVITVIVAGIILTLVFKLTDDDWLLGIITEIPVILVIAWVFASMYLMGMALNVMTIMISSLTVGLGITYGIHVTHRFVEDLAELDDVDEACKSTVTNTGAALFGAAITTIGGFGILIFAPIPPMRKFGAISALSITFSLIASVFILPTFLSLWAKAKKRSDPCYFQHHADVKHKMEEKVLSCDGPKEMEYSGKDIKTTEETKDLDSTKSAEQEGEKTPEPTKAGSEPVVPVPVTDPAQAAEQETLPKDTTTTKESAPPTKVQEETGEKNEVEMPLSSAVPEVPLPATICPSCKNPIKESSAAGFEFCESCNKYLKDMEKKE